MKSKSIFRLGVYLVILLLAVILIIYIIHESVSKPVTSQNINGKSIEEVLKEYGSPDHIHSLILSDSVMYQYRGGLITIFGKDKIKSKQIQVMEYWWKDYKENFVVWFYYKNNRWISIDNLRWNYQYINF